MAPILVYLSTQNGRVRRSSLEVLSECRRIASDRQVVALVADAAPDEAIVTAAEYGASHVYVVRHPLLGRHLNAPVLAAIEAAIAEVAPSVFAAASTEGTKDVLGALAARLNAPALPDVSTLSISGENVEAVRPVMAAKQLARVRASAALVLLTVRSGSFDAAPAQGAPAVTEVPFSMDADTLPLVLREIVQATGGTVDLSEARVVVAAGRGVRDEAGKALVQELADLFDGAIGASRAVVEMGLFPATAQIGQTGKVVSPDLYFALGISGAIQHVAGMTNSRVIVAINKDPDAPIFKYATYGLVGDLFRILPPLISALKEARGRG